MASIRRVFAWLKSINAIKMEDDIPLEFRSYVIVMRVMGAWPTTDNSSSYKWLRIAVYLFVGIQLPLSLFVNIFYVNSTVAALDYSFTSLVCCATMLKTIVLYWHRDNIRELFRSHAGLVRGVEQKTAYHNRIGRQNFIIHAALTALYAMSYCYEIVQVICVPPEKRTFSSTAHYPWKLTGNRTVFLIVLIVQSVDAAILVVSLSLHDSFPLSFMNTGCGHLGELKLRLQRLGSTNNDADFYKEVVECCQRYENCLRYAAHLAILNTEYI